MQLVLSEDQELLAKTASDWVREHSPVARVRQLRDTNDPTGFSRPLWKQMAELGWVGIIYPEAYGGAGMGFADLAVVLEALGRTLAPEPFLSTVLLGGQTLLVGGSDAQKTAWLPGLCEGDKLLALAQQEAKSRHDPFRVATTAKVHLEKGEAGFSITRIDLACEAQVPGIDDAKFQEIANRAKTGCPVSKLLKARITMEAKLEG